MSAAQPGAVPSVPGESKLRGSVLPAIQQAAPNAGKQARHTPSDAASTLTRSAGATADPSRRPAAWLA